MTRTSLPDPTPSPHTRTHLYATRITTYKQASLPTRVKSTKRVNLSQLSKGRVNSFCSFPMLRTLGGNHVNNANHRLQCVIVTNCPTPNANSQLYLASLNTQIFFGNFPCTWESAPVRLRVTFTVICSHMFVGSLRLGYQL